MSLAPVPPRPPAPSCLTFTLIVLRVEVDGKVMGHLGGRRGTVSWVSPQDPPRPRLVGAWACGLGPACGKGLAEGVARVRGQTEGPWARSSPAASGPRLLSCIDQYIPPTTTFFCLSHVNGYLQLEEDSRLVPLLHTETRSLSSVLRGH